MGFVIGNVYAITAVAVVGGALFGFDISSMSAIISTPAYLCYFNQGPLYLDTDGKCSGPTPNVQGTPRESSRLTLISRVHRWYHRVHARWFMAGFAGFRLPLRYPREKEVHPNWLHHLVYRFNSCLRFTKHRHVDCRTYHQRSRCRDLLCPGPRLCKSIYQPDSRSQSKANWPVKDHRDRATLQAWKTCWYPAM
jgi:hypothetical protein